MLCPLHVREEDSEVRGQLKWSQGKKLPHEKRLMRLGHFGLERRKIRGHEIKSL